MTPNEKLTEIEKKFHIAFMNQRLTKEDTLWLFARIKSLTRVLEFLNANHDQTYFGNLRIEIKKVLEEE